MEWIQEEGEVPVTGAEEDRDMHPSATAPNANTATSRSF